MSNENSGSNSRSSESQKEKQQYNPPKLKRYGSVERRTGGGSGTMTEGTMMLINRRPA